MLVFVRECIRNYNTTGAIFPSSKNLARIMTRPGERPPGPERILEVGPGTGPFTRTLLHSLRPGDELHIVEINPGFCESLQRAVIDPYLRTHPNAHVRLYNAPIQDVKLEGEFDRIVCGLPFTNFPASLVRQIFRRMMDLLKPGGELTYFEYVAARQMKATVSGPRGWRNLRRISAFNKSMRKRHGGKSDLVLGNIPPAIALRLVRNETVHPAAADSSSRS